MRVPYTWLREYLTTPLAPEELAHRLTMAGLEVEQLVRCGPEDGDDLVLSTKVTSNRGDLLSMLSVARLAAAVAGGEVSEPALEVSPAGPVTATEAQVTIEDPAGCPRYSAVLVRGVRVGPSPAWMQQRLLAAGMRPINNVVDCTNYVLWELGQPLHAFDCRLLRGEEGRAHVIVRRARPAEKLTTIDGQERELQSTDLVIADAERAVALAGIMGGEDTEVSATTTGVLIESAHFHPAMVRRSAQRLGMSTEASYRFERHVDPSGTLRAAWRAAQLMVATAGGSVAPAEIDVYPTPHEPRPVPLRPERCSALLGIALSTDEVIELLGRFGLAGDRREDGTLLVTVPTSRPDIGREVDLIEEVAIAYGYERIPGTLPHNRVGAGLLTPAQRLERRLRTALTQCGLCEAISFAMIEPSDLDRLGLSPDAPERNMLRLARRTEEGLSAMRTTLLPSLLASAGRNARRGVRNIALYELDRVFLPKGADELPDEPRRLGIVVGGSLSTSDWNTRPEHAQVDFYALKGIVVELLDALGIRDAAFRRGAHPPFHPGRCAEVLREGHRLGLLGQVAPQVAEAYDLATDVFIAELDAEALLAAAVLHKPHAPVPPQPPVLRDIAVVVPDDDAHSAAVLAAAVREAAGPLLQRVEPFDVYADPKRLGAGRKSLAFSLELRAPDRSLTGEEADAVIAAVVEHLRAKLGAELRAS